MFLLPSAHRVEKSGSVTNSGRWVLWHELAQEPIGRCRPMGRMIVDIMNRVRSLYREEKGAFPEPVLKLDWPASYDSEEMARRINGRFLANTACNGTEYKAGDQVPSFAALADNGGTMCLNWLYSGSYTKEEGNKARRRDLTQTPMQRNIGLFPNYSWCWPVNRRILYNRASVDLHGNPLAPQKAVIRWTGTGWEGDVPDGGWPPPATGGEKHPFIMQTHGFGQIFGPGRADGPLPEHYEPVESPLTRNPFSARLNNPCFMKITGGMDALARPGDARFPIVLTTYTMTEMWCGGAETRNTPNLLEAEPQLYVEMSHELAKEKGIRNGDPVLIESARGTVEAIAMVTVRIVPFKVEGRTVHLVGMPFCYGWTTRGAGDATNRLTASIGDPNTGIPEYKALMVNVTRAGKLRELDHG